MCMRCTHLVISLFPKNAYNHTLLKKCIMILDSSVCAVWNWHLNFPYNARREVCGCEKDEHQTC